MERAVTKHRFTNWDKQIVSLLLQLIEKCRIYILLKQQDDQQYFKTVMENIVYLISDYLFVDYTL